MPQSTTDKPDGQAKADISVLRQAIDEIDAKILDLINRRLLLAQQIGEVKRQGDIQITDHRRENEIMDRLRRLNKGSLAANDLQRIFAAIVAAGRNIQKKTVDHHD